MAEYQGTAGADTVTVTAGDTYKGLAGDDRITLLTWSTGEGGPGNDTIIVDPSVKQGEAVVWYWSSQNNIYVDLAAGYALDGYGTRDTLVNVYSVHGFSKDGDQGYGSAKDDHFWVGPRSNLTKGRIILDGRDSSDRVSISVNSSENRGSLILQASADGRLVTAYHQNSPGLIYELRNIETVTDWRNLDAGKYSQTAYTVIDLISLDATAASDILLRGSKGWQTGALGQPIALSYSFLSSAPASGAEGGTGFQAFSSAQQQAVREILAKLQQQIGISFTESSADAGQIRFGINQQSNTRGYSYLPGTDAKAGDVWLDVETSAVLQPGQEGYYVLLHEIVHALGLLHPLPASDQSGATVLLDRFATFNHTLMLDVAASSNTSGVWPSWYGLLDIQALQSLYGKKAQGLANDLYKLTDSTNSLLLTDEGGIDTLDISGSSLSGHIDLRPGKTGSFGLNAEGLANFNNLTLAPTTWIENLIATANDDFIIGNSLNNVITSLGGNDIIQGAEGTDTVVLPGKRADWRVSKSTAEGIWNATAKDGARGSVELTDVERLRFDDMQLVVGVTAGSQAVTVVKVLGATFGPNSAKDPSYVSIGLSYMEQQNYSYEQLMQLALSARLGTNVGDARSVVNLLYTNVIGNAPTEAEARPFVDMLLNNLYTPSKLAVIAAETPQNLTRIGFTGLLEEGVPIGL